MIAYKSVLVSSGGSGGNVPNGATVFPTDDIQTLLNCADIWDKSYTTIEEFIKDSWAMAIVFNSVNAVSYLLRSTSWVSDVCSCRNSVMLIGSSANFFALWIDATWGNGLRNSSYIDFAFNYEVPTMTSNSTPSGNVFSSSFYSNAYAPWYAFTDNKNDGQNYFSTVAGDVVDSYIGYEFTEDVKICEIVLSNNATNYSVKEFEVQYQDNNTWITNTNSSFVAQQTSAQQIFFINPDMASNAWRILVKSNHDTRYSSNYLYIKRLQFRGN